MDKKGALLVADDVGNTVWRVSRAEHPPTASNSAAGAILPTALGASPPAER
jgi:hypothetical protein